MSSRFAFVARNATHKLDTNLTKSLLLNGTLITAGGIISCIILSFCSLLTVLGNCLVILAVIKERCLRTVTNYFIVSLAAADLVMGSIVMPFAISQELLRGAWIYGSLWCDIWHATDVWSSTCSILNLCAIAVERYYATHNPILHAARISSRRITISVAAIWAFSAIISFPAIFWWRSLQILPRNELVCTFTTDRIYLLLSSFISFYAPLTIMGFVYYKIYKIAVATLQSVKSGCRIVTERSELGDNSIVLNVHRGGIYETKSSRSPSIVVQSEGSTGHVAVDDKPIRKLSAGHLSPFSNSRKHYMNDLPDYENHNVPSSSQSMSSVTSPVKLLRNKLRSILSGKKTKQFAREQRAAKTLGIVMGIFVLCWLPFFICNVIVAIDKDLIRIEEYHCQLTMTIVIWFGYANSSINPIIYAHSMRDFRTAFVKILSCLEIRKWWQQRTEFDNYRKPSVVTSEAYKSRSVFCLPDTSVSLLDLRINNDNNFV